jgi:hypothetical protein
MAAADAGKRRAVMKTSVCRVASIVAIVPALMVAGAAAARAQQSGEMTFASAGDGARALAQAIQDRDDHALEQILGAGPEVTSSGDAAADTLEREHFVRKYREMHRLVQEPDGMVVLYVGAENWPFPIPLASSQGRWFFDAKTGAAEILVRRIGEHESNAIDACRSLIAASPSGDELNNETAEGYRFRTITAHTVRATSGGNSIGKIKFLAYPVEYRASGVMTFIVTGDGAVYQRDLGSETARRAEAIAGAVPRSGWTLVRD